MVWNTREKNESKSWLTDLGDNGCSGRFFGGFIMYLPGDWKEFLTRSMILYEKEFKKEPTGFQFSEETLTLMYRYAWCKIGYETYYNCPNPCNSLPCFLRFCIKNEFF